MILPMPSFTLNQIKSLPFLTDEALYEACGVRVVFTGRKGGVSKGVYSSLNTASHVGDSIIDVEENCHRVCEVGGVLGAECIVPNQVHGTNLVCVSHREEVGRVRAQAEKGADGIVVEAFGVGALLNFADCLSVIIVSPSGYFAVVHAGWRGAVAGIAGNAVQVLDKRDSCKPHDYNVYFGPHIRSKCFEVGDEVIMQFKAVFGKDVCTDDHHVSLRRAVMVDLERAGINPFRIADSGICTKCHSDSFFSYRDSGGACGRHAAFAITHKKNQSSFQKRGLNS